MKEPTWSRSYEHVLLRPDATIHYWTGGPADGTDRRPAARRHTRPPRVGSADRRAVASLSMSSCPTCAGTGRRPAASGSTPRSRTSWPCWTSCRPGGSSWSGSAWAATSRRRCSAASPTGVRALVAADTTCNTAARHPLAASLSVAAVQAQAAMAGDGFARQAARATAVNPQVQRVRHGGQRPSLHTGRRWHILTSLLTTALHSEPDYRLPVPTLLVHGQLDRIGDIASAMPAWAEREPLARYAAIPDAGHASNLDQPRGLHRARHRVHRRGAAWPTGRVRPRAAAEPTATPGSRRPALLARPRAGSTTVPGSTEKWSCTSGPARPTRWAPTFDGGGTNFAIFSEVAERIELCLFDDAGRRAAGRPARAQRAGLARLPAPGRARPALRLPGARPVRPGRRAALQPDQAAARPVRQGDRRAHRPGTRRCSPTGSATRTPTTTPTPRPYAMTSVVINPFFDWADDRPLRIPYNETVIYEAHVKGMTMRHPDIPERRARHLRRARAPGDDPALPAAGGDRGRADAGAPVRARLHAGREGPVATTGATTPSASSPRTTTTPASAPAASRCWSSRRWSGRCTGPGIEVILDVVYNHTAEGNHLGPTLSFRGIDNQAYYRLVDRRPAALLRHHRHRQQPQRAPPRVAAADHGLAAVLGHRDARRRVPVRPGLRAGPGVPRGRPAVGVLRPGQPGPGRQPGQADRRAVGRRRGRLPGRRLPAAVDGVERQVPRHRARLLARRAGQPRRVRLPLHRLAPTCTRPTTAGPSPRSTS